MLNDLQDLSIENKESIIKKLPENITEQGNLKKYIY